MGAALLPPVPASAPATRHQPLSAVLCSALLALLCSALLCPARAALLDLCASGSLSAPLLCAACAALRCSAVSSFALRSALCALCFSALSLCALSLYSLPLVLRWSRGGRRGLESSAAGALVGPVSCERRSIERRRQTLSRCLGSSGSHRSRAPGLYSRALSSHTSP